MAKKEDKPLSFEDAVGQLETIVQAIESGQIGLEESLAQYEQGMELVKQCRSVLDRAEKRIELLTQTAQGLKADPLDPATLLPPTP